MGHVQDRHVKIMKLLLCCLLFSDFFLHMPEIPAQASADKRLTLEQVYSLALACSEEYEKLNTQKNAKLSAYEAALKSIQMKKQNASSFRWSPLVSLKFPEAAKLSEEFEYTYKPYTLQAEITAIEHQLNDVKYSIREKAAVLFAGLYEKQEIISFNEKKLEELRAAQNRLEARAYTGKAARTEEEKTRKAIDALTAVIAADSSVFLADKIKLGDMLQLDITTGYTFANPFVEVNLSRQDLETLIKRTLDYNQELFEKKLASSAGMTAMELNYSLMKEQYGDAAAPLESYIRQAREGEKISSAALKADYQQVLTAVDEPWKGNFKVLFVSIPKEWLKGDASGIRYLEDDPYVLYTSILDYRKACQEQAEMEKELRGQVTDAYASLAAVRNAYFSSKKNTEQCRKDLDVGILQNRQGSVTAEEVEALRGQYYESSTDELKALADYSRSIYSFDRLTCGGVTQLLEEAGLTAASEDKSRITANTAEGASYYIRNIVEDNSFEFGIFIPEDFAAEVTDYELWVDNTQVGTRTAADKTIVHLNLSVSGAKKVFVRLYNGEEFIDDSEIDPAAYGGKLDVTEGYSVTRGVSNVIGSFTYTTNVASGITTIQLRLNADEPAKTYIVKNAQGMELMSGRKVDVTDAFSYLNLAAGSIDELQIVFYDKFGSSMYTARLNSVKLTIEKDAGKQAD